MRNNIIPFVEGLYSFQHNFVVTGANPDSIQVFVHQTDGKPKSISVCHLVNDLYAEKKGINYQESQTITIDTYDINPVIVLEHGVLSVKFTKSPFRVHDNETLNLTHKITQRKT